MKKQIHVSIGKKKAKATFVEQCSLNASKATMNAIKQDLLAEYDGYVRKRGKSFYFYYGYRNKA